MQRVVVITCALIFPLISAHGRPATETLAPKLVDRAVDLMRDGSGYIFDIPLSPRRDQAGLARHLRQSLLSYRDHKHRGKNDPMIIFSTDPPLAATVARLAFSDCPRGSLRGLRVICLVGRDYDAWLRPSATAAGARLEVERVPK